MEIINKIEELEKQLSELKTQHPEAVVELEIKRQAKLAESKSKRKNSRTKTNKNLEARNNKFREFENELRLFDLIFDKQATREQYFKLINYATNKRENKIKLELEELLDYGLMEKEDTSAWGKVVQLSSFSVRKISNNDNLRAKKINTQGDSLRRNLRINDIRLFVLMNTDLKANLQGEESSDWKNYQLTQQVLKRCKENYAIVRNIVPTYNLSFLEDFQNSEQIECFVNYTTFSKQDTIQVLLKYFSDLKDNKKAHLAFYKQIHFSALKKLATVPTSKHRDKAKEYREHLYQDGAFLYARSRALNDYKVKSNYQNLSDIEKDRFSLLALQDLTSRFCFIRKVELQDGLIHFHLDFVDMLGNLDNIALEYQLEAITGIFETTFSNEEKDLYFLHLNIHLATTKDLQGLITRAKEIETGKKRGGSAKTIIKTNRINYAFYFENQKVGEHISSFQPVRVLKSGYVIDEMDAEEDNFGIIERKPQRIEKQQSQTNGQVKRELIERIVSLYQDITQNNNNENSLKTAYRLCLQYKKQFGKPASDDEYFFDEIEKRAKQKGLI